MCRHNRQQRSIIASALLVGLQEYQQSRNKSRALPSSSTPDMTTTRSFQEPMTQGVTYIAPHYAEPTDPNPPAYEEVATATTNNNNNIPAIIDEKRLLQRLSTEEQVPPHVSRDYNPNTGLDASVPRFTPPAPPLITLSPAASTTCTIHQTPTSLSHLLAAISLYFDTQIKLHSDQPSTVRKLETKKAKKLSKAEKKFHEHMAKGKDSTKRAEKMDKRAEKMEKYTEWVLQRLVQQQQYSERHMHGRRRHCGGRCCGSAVHTSEQYRSVVV